MTVARLVIVCLFGLLLVPAASPAAGPEATRASMAKQMRWAGGASGALVVDLNSGEIILESRADVPRIPASVNKLFTTAAALLRFGPETTLQTSVLAPVPVDELGVLPGDLYLRGVGDPALTTQDIKALAADLVSLTGLVEVQGRVIGDESVFDALRGGPASRYRTSGYVGPLGGLVVDGGRTGKRRPYFQARPALFAAQALHDALKELGITMGKAPREGLTPEGAVPLAAHASATMTELSRRANVPSDNHVSEMLLKDLGVAFGGAGSTAAGAEAAEDALEELLGVRPHMIDGSGLARGNRVTPRQVIDLLEAMSLRAEFAPFRDSLAVAGRTGTLHRRMRSSPARDRCRGKTGSLYAVSALAGYCQTRGGELVAYAFLMNRVNLYGARVLQDRMLGALARYDAP